MVSTRGLRYKFSEGERVLCYEPDPNKAKVLYDSKVLEVIESKDKRGRRTVEYLIHFQGWNSSWDRCVSEDFVLKDTEENRQLQRDLAEKSQLQLGAYLYRRERKKGGSMSMDSGTTKRNRLGFSDEDSPTTPVDDLEGGDIDSSSGECEGDDSVVSPPTDDSRYSITLPSVLRDRLTFDYHVVMKKGRLSRLPAVPCVAEILESFVKWYARAGAWHPPRQRHDPPLKPDLLEVSCRLNLIRKVADGLRLYFDFVLRGHLLYKPEFEQYHKMCGEYFEKEQKLYQEACAAEMKRQAEIKSENDGSESVLDYLWSPKIPEYSHLPPDPDGRVASAPDTPNDNDSITNDEDNDQENQAPKKERSGHHNTSAIDGRNNNNTSNVHRATGSTRPSTGSCSQGLTEPEERLPPAKQKAVARSVPQRRLRSHKSLVSPSEPEEPPQSTSTCEPPSSSVCSSGSSLSEGAPLPPLPAAAPARTPLSQLLDKVAQWRIIPSSGTEHWPCRVYGATHLARLFVRLPAFLQATTMPDHKLKMLLKHIDLFITYLNEHSEWFGESTYGN